jgi:hypothetical protein
LSLNFLYTFIHASSLITLVAIYPFSGEYLQRISQAVDVLFTKFSLQPTHSAMNPDAIPNRHRFVIAFDRVSPVY